MRRKTQRVKPRRGPKYTAIQSIPELRRSFDYIDEFVAHRIQSGVSKDALVKEVQQEWSRVFGKRMEKKNAMAFVEHQMELASRRRRPLRGKTRRRHRGGVAPFADPSTQPGVYLASGLPPTSAGHYPMANNSTSAYGSLTAYLNKGFMDHPENSLVSPPVPGQSAFPSSAISPLLKGGARGRVPRTHNKKYSGGSLPLVGSAFTQMTVRPFPSTTPPPNFANDAQHAWYGGLPGSSPDQIQRTPSYQLGDSMHPKMVSVNIDV